MLVNEKVWRKKSPEAVALAATESFYSIYSRGPGQAGCVGSVVKEFAQSEVDMELARVAKAMADEEKRKEALKHYVV